METVGRNGMAVWVDRNGIRVQRTYSRVDKAKEAERRLHASRAARDRFMTRKGR
jgi:hypothetical protein